jgi:hypothetical protein
VPFELKQLQEGPRQRPPSSKRSWGILVTPNWAEKTKEASLYPSSRICCYASLAVSALQEPNAAAIGNVTAAWFSPSRRGHGHGPDLIKGSREASTIPSTQDVGRKELQGENTTHSPDMESCGSTETQNFRANDAFAANFLDSRTTDRRSTSARARDSLNRTTSAIETEFGMNSSHSGQASEEIPAG